mmetsp:Transcript_35990/g.26734  ORF Transcript_35990/g.26734 Transcript_35990/m.26734 type:complete len:109 (+) Transcript_35990:329-655(+)
MILNLVNDLLDMAKMENLTFNLNYSYFNLLDAISEVLTNINFQAKQKQIIMQLQYDPQQVGYFTHVHGDKNRYQQILINFLSNSIKFTPQNGSVIIELVLKETQFVNG